MSKSVLELIPHERTVSYGHVWRQARKYGWVRHDLNATIRGLIADGAVIRVGAQIRRDND